MVDKKILGQMHGKNELDESEILTLTHLKSLYAPSIVAEEDHRLTVNKCRAKVDRAIHNLRLKEKLEVIKKKCDELVTEIEHRPDLAFKMIREKRTFNLINVLKDSNGKVHTDPERVKSVLRDAWAPIFKTNDANPIQEIEDSAGPHIGHEILRRITMANLRKTIKRLKKNKTPGIDIIPNEALQNLTETDYETLLDLLNKINEKKELPSTWRTAPVTLIHKGGSKVDPLNYHPIALLTTAYKVYSHIINERLNDVLTKHKIIHDDQYGFRKGRSTAQCILEHIACIKDAKLREKFIHIIYIAFKKAYDSVEHTALVNAMKKYNFDPEVTSLIKMMIQGNSVQLKTEYGLTDKIEVTRGV